MEDEEFDNLYEDLLDNGLINEDYKQKFKKLLDALKDNLGQIKSYAEIDASEWGNPYY